MQFYTGGKLVDAAAELVALFLADPAPGSALMRPMFRDPGSNRPLKVKDLRRIVKAIASAWGLDPGFFGAHSLR